MAKCSPFCDPEELRRSPERARVFRGGPSENVSKKTPQSPVLRGDAFHELRRSPESSTAARELSARASFFGLPRSCCPGLPHSSRNASSCGKKRFWKNGWAPSQLKNVKVWAPLQLIRIYFYIIHIDTKIHVHVHAAD